MLREDVDLLLVERADQERADEARQHERRVAVALAPRQLEVARGQVQRHPAELGDAHLEADAGARGRLVEDHPDRPSGQDAELLAPEPLLFQLVGEVERELEFLARPVRDARVASALEAVRDACHRAMLARLARFPPMTTFQERLNEQIAYEFGASQQYIAIAVHYDAQTLPQLAAHFYRQAVEERNHAMMMVQYLLDSGDDVVTPAVAAPQTVFADDVEPVALALDQEKRVTAQISQLAVIARENGDLVAEQFMHWFLQEQREEVSSMSALLQVVERCATT